MVQVSIKRVIHFNFNFFFCDCKRHNRNVKIITKNDLDDILLRSNIQNSLMFLIPSNIVAFVVILDLSLEIMANLQVENNRLK